MAYKLTCPHCDTYTSAIFRAYEDGRPATNPSPTATAEPRARTTPNYPFGAFLRIGSRAQLPDLTADVAMPPSDLVPDWSPRIIRVPEVPVGSTLVATPDTSRRAGMSRRRVA